MPQAITDPNWGLPATSSAAQTVTDTSDPNWGLPVFKQSDRSPNELDPNTVRTAVKAFWEDANPAQLGQLLPFPKVAGGSGTDHPLALNPHEQYAPNFVVAMKNVKKEGDTLWAKGDHAAALAKYVESVVPLIGPWMSQRGNEAQSGQWMKLLGHTLGMATNVYGSKVAGDIATAQYPLTAHPAATAPPVAPAAVRFAQQRGIPLDAATVSDNLAVKGTQALADRSLGGSLVATPANAAREAAMTRVGGELADEAAALPATPEQAGTSLRNALSAKVQGHAQRANQAYETVRSLEGPENAVDLASVKQALTPLYEQMKRQMPVTQQQANPGLKALENIVTGPDFAPLSQVDRDLSTVKTIAREQGGLAKVAVSRLDAAVQHAARAGDPAIWRALQDGRTATIAKYAASDVLDTLNAEPVRTVKALTAPKDSAIQALRAVTTQVPDEAPTLARAYLEQLLDAPQKVAEWRKLGSQTKAILFPNAGQTAALDHFFELTDRISKTNVNPSGSGYMASLGAQGAMIWYDPLHVVPLQISGAVLSKLLRSPAVVNVLTRGLQLPATTPTAVRAAATANLVQAAAKSGVVLTFPTAADQEATP